MNLNGGVDYLPQTSESHQALLSSVLRLGVYFKPLQPQLFEDYISLSTEITDFCDCDNTGW